jgi:hypothetical protein
MDARRIQQAAATAANGQAVLMGGDMAHAIVELVDGTRAGGSVKMGQFGPLVVLVVEIAGAKAVSMPRVLFALGHVKAVRIVSTAELAAEANGD